MKIKIVLIMLAFFVMISVAFLPSAAAHQDGMYVILVGPNEEISIGEEVEIEVHVFHKGEYVDPDDAPELRASGSYSYYGTSDPVTVDTTKKSDGIYTGKVEIDEDLVEDSSSAYVRLNPLGETKDGTEYSLSYQKDGKNDTKFDYIGEYEADSVYLYIDEEDIESDIIIEYELLNIDDFPWEPGETIEFRIKVSEDGMYKSPDSFNIDIDEDSYYYAPSTSGSGVRADPSPDLEYDETTDGVYECELEIPDDLDSQTQYDIEVMVTEGGEEYYEDFYVDIEMFQVWAHRLSPASSRDQDFEIWVSDVNGKKVVGAEIELDYYVMSSSRTETRYEDDDYYIDDDYDPPGYGSLTGTTDTSGKATFSISDVDGDIDLEGSAKDDGRTQRFYGEIAVQKDDGPKEPKPSNYGFEVLTRDSQFEPKKGKVSHEFIAYNDGEKLKSQEIYYYATHQEGIAGYGKATTDSNGEFKAEFDDPPSDYTSISIYFETGIGYHPGVWDAPEWKDSDYDGFSDSFEDNKGTDKDDYNSYPQSYKDSDGDHFGDDFEINEKTDPEDYSDYPCGYKDSDGDSFGDKYEISEKTDPNDSSDYPGDFKDSDNDGYGDEFEIDQGTNPDSYWSYPYSSADNDSDGHSDEHEEFYGTDPNDPTDYPHNSYKVNSDGDTASYWGSDYQWDLEEVFYGTDPNDSDDYPYDDYGTDSDYDGIRDKEEEFYGTDPEDRSDHPEDIYQKDSDYDGVKDEEEKFYGTDPDDYYDDPSEGPSPWDERWSDHNSTDGKKYESDYNYLSKKVDIGDVYSDDSVKVSISKFKVGGRTTVEVDGGDDNSFAVAAWFIGDIDDIDIYGDDDIQQDWIPLAEPEIEMFKSGGKHKGIIVAPEFLPKGNQKYTVLGGVYNSKGIHVNNVVVKNGESGSSDDEPGFFSGNTRLLIIIIAIVLISLIFLILLIVIIVAIIKKAVKSSNDDKKPGAETPAAQPAQPAAPAGQTTAAQPQVMQQGQPAQTAQQPAAQPQVMQQGQPAQTPGAQQPTVMEQGGTSQAGVYQQGQNWPPPPPPA